MTGEQLLGSGAVNLPSHPHPTMPVRRWKEQWLRVPFEGYECNVRPVRSSPQPNPTKWGLGATGPHSSFPHIPGLIPAPPKGPGQLSQAQGSCPCSAALPGLAPCSLAKAVSARGGCPKAANWRCPPGLSLAQGWAVNSPENCLGMQRARHRARLVRQLKQSSRAGLCMLCRAPTTEA